MACRMKHIRGNPLTSWRFVISCAANRSPLVGKAPSASEAESQAEVNSRALAWKIWSSADLGRLDGEELISYSWS